ncbi:MAG: hypothetical protein J6P60_01920, partial [Lachnospiraceae bacterium]|nr:hypothetical protein [Lachnospiraceae bacterium]
KLLMKHQITPEQANLKSLLLTVRYDGKRITCTSGTAYTTFVMDKTIDAIWDRALTASFDALGVAFEELL